MGSATSVSAKCNNNIGIPPESSAKSFRSQRSLRGSHHDPDENSASSDKRSVRITASGGVSGRSKRIIADDDSGAPMRIVATGSTSRPVEILTDSEIEERNVRRSQVLKQNEERRDKIKRKNLSNLITRTVNHLIQDAVVSRSEEQAKQVELFRDSVYIPKWLSRYEADSLFEELAQIGEKSRPKDIAAAVKSKAKYPLWTKYYGFKRKLDGARALDRWGSYHEGWMRVEEPPPRLTECCNRLRQRFHLTSDDVNSMVANYYYDGDHTYISAHRDTTACLTDGSHVICLSLGASRDFILCDNSDAGKFERDEVTIVKEWRVSHGDIFALGQQTNYDYCHVVPQEPGLTKMRISVIFRSIDKSFIELESAPKKDAIYSNGTVKRIAAECITCSGYNDIGKREHISDLINERERQKKLKIDAKKLLSTPEKKKGANVAEETKSALNCSPEIKELANDVKKKYKELTVYEQEVFASHVDIIQDIDTSSPVTDKENEEIRGAEAVQVAPSTSKLGGVAALVAQEHLNSSRDSNDAPFEIGCSAGLRTASTDEHHRKPSIITETTAATLSSYYMGEGYAVPVNPRAKQQQ